MGIYIPGIKTPKNCITCPFMVSRENDDCILQSLEANAHAESWEQLREGCPLIELPPHGRLGDLDALIIDLMDRGVDGVQTDDLHEILQTIMDANTIIPAEEEEGDADG